VRVRGAVVAALALLATLALPASAQDRQQAREELERLEVEIHLADEEIRSAAIQLREQEQRLQALEDQLHAAQSRLDERKGRMELRLRAMYRFRHRGFLPLLFSADSPHELLRSARYLWWIVRADQDAVDTWNADLEGADRLGAELAEGRAELLQRAGEVATRREEMVRLRDERQALLGHHRDPVDRRRMRTVIQGEPADSVDVRLDLRAEEPPELVIEEVHPSSTFERSRGLLPLPVVGTVSRSGRGVDIAADEGAPIRAVHPGFVLKVQPVEGYGLVCFVDHGDGWLTVYGHGAGFDVQAGEIVSAGDVLGRVGAAGSLDGPKLHFEVRVDRIPQDPFEWLNIPAGIRVKGR
jgi:murein hydrolase activator